MEHLAAGRSAALIDVRIEVPTPADLTELAKERADAVKAAFVEAGIAAERITTADQKSESPADPNEGEVALSKNRRVEFELEQ